MKLNCDIERARAVLRAGYGGPFGFHADRLILSAAFPGTAGAGVSILQKATVFDKFEEILSSSIFRRRGSPLRILPPEERALDYMRRISVSLDWFAFASELFRRRIVQQGRNGRGLFRMNVPVSVVPSTRRHARLLPEKDVHNITR
jgi:hypothetical protein